MTFFFISDPVWASVNFCVCVCAKCIGKFISQPKGLLQATQVLQESAVGLHLIVVLQNCEKKKNETIAFIQRENNLRYLSKDMICSERLVKEHVMAKDKYTSIILSQLETIVYIYIHPNIFCTARDVLIKNISFLHGMLTFL